MSLLELSGVAKHFGGVKAVDGVDFKVNEGEIVSVIGPNGAGKTTLFNIVTGFYDPTSGQIVFDGHDITGLKPNQVTTVGISRTFQSVRLFKNMTVLENAMVGQHSRTKSSIAGAIFRPPGTRKEEERIERRAKECLAFFGDRFPRRMHDELAAGLSYADRRRLEIARAMATEPKLVLLDEPAAGMNPKETAGLTGLIGRLRDELGLTVVVIEHDMRVVKGVSDRVMALDYGKKIAEGSYQEVSSNERVIEAYLGKRHEDTQAARAPEAGSKPTTPGKES
ncbi:MAG: ABC transporter ATP-binding protein [Actinomycetota bacterium]|nr:ABC transporter ATP-binding protein [Actinomycetota bacterium]